MNAFRKIDEERKMHELPIVTATSVTESDWSKNEEDKYKVTEIDINAKNLNEDTFKLFNYSGRHNFAINGNLKSKI